MESPSRLFDPHKVTTPIQLVAVWFLCMFALVGAFLTASGTTPDSFLRQVFAWTAVVLIPVFVSLIFAMQTRFRRHLINDEHYIQLIEIEQKEYRGFRPENTPEASAKIDSTPVDRTSWEDVEGIHEKSYIESHGYFLVHTWRPSREPNQVADIVLKIHRHFLAPEDAPDIREVEYYCGPYFFDNEVVKKRNKSKEFRLEVSAWGAFMCFARIHFQSNEEPVILKHLVYFPGCRSEPIE